MKRVVDELIGLGSVLSAYADTGIWPKRVHPDSIGQLLDCEELCSLEPYSGHKDLLVALNDVHNAQKHSFLNSDTTLWAEMNRSQAPFIGRVTKSMRRWRCIPFR